MNLFFTALNSSYEKFVKIQKTMEALQLIFPELKYGQSFSYSSEGHKDFIFLLFSPEEDGRQRIYFAEDNDYILFYSGLPIDTSQKINAHDSSRLLAHFESIKYEYEGQASIIRYNEISHEADIITDIMGMEQVYYCNQWNQLFISNHVGLIETASGSTKIDLDGASHFLSIGWVGNHFTLKQDIHLIRGGEHWKWDRNKQSIAKKVYFDPKEIKPASKEVLKKKEIDNLYIEMENYLQILEKNFSLECPLTGGYDSRLVTALLLDKKLQAEYYTAGSPEYNDAVIASKIAAAFNLKYKLYEMDYEYLFNNWDGLVKNLILQNNGMASLWQVFNLLTHLEPAVLNDKSKVRLTTHGAEAARAAYNRTFLWDKKITKKDVFIYLTNRTLANANLLLSDLSIDMFYKFFDSFFRFLTGNDVDYRLIPDYFYIYERLGRHHGNNWRINRASADIFSLFCSRVYLRAALRVHPVDKIVYPLHYRIMKKINTKLFEMPTIYGKWPLQSGKVKHYLNKVKPLIGYFSRFKPANIVKNGTGKKRILSAYDRKLLLDTRLDEIRNVCFDNAGSELWQLINRKKLEEILCPESEIQQEGLPQIFNIATLFYYEHLSRSN